MVYLKLMNIENCHWVHIMQVLNCSIGSGSASEEVPIYNHSSKINIEIKIDDIVPLGEECCTCQFIDSKFNEATKTLRKYALPFDYVGHTFVEQILEKIRTEKGIENEIVTKQFGSDYFYYDSKFGFCYWHDIKYSNPTLFQQNELETFKTKYNRRYERLYSLINSDKNVCFITVQHFDKIYNNVEEDSNIMNLYTYLSNKNSNCILIAINFIQDCKQINNCFFVNLNFLKTDIFEESKLSFQQSLKVFYNTIFIE